MKFTPLAFSALAAAVSAETINLVTVSDNHVVTGQYLSSIHEGAGFNYFLLSTVAGDSLTYSDKAITEPQGDYTANLGVMGDYLAIGPAVTPSSATFPDGEYLTLDSGVKFWACLNTSDPYQYSSSNYIVLTGSTAPFDSCVAVSLRKETAGSASSSAAAASTTGWANTTTTDVKTVTDYTTYCPASTLVTITKCSEDKCSPTTITVASATTLTVTGTCVVPVSTTAAPTSLTTVKSSSLASSTVAAASVLPGAAAQNVAGLMAGVAGIAALLI